jgi:hypothetical protein
VESSADLDALEILLNLSLSCTVRTPEQFIRCLPISGEQAVARVYLL